ncbi:EF-hand domain-containing protein [Pseudoxanthomonas taiwanensis]|uniref:EF-hand domain-containing protein n=1 Tax=Pseudoxanthomonas taiwanensis TaxID=176598 RepID=A0A921TH69_9GAMM|nr:EF-hand domain-containing protein [Pseudoxanthomonas taiwanensis]KAF1687115.1 hypothetical protein CR938_11670 [Pseudoxanthomonas taiwanensis]
MSSNKKPVVLALGTALVGGLALSGSAFGMESLGQGYMVGASAGDKAQEGKCGEGKCGADRKAGEGKCGEGKCGMDKMDTDKDGRISRAEFAAAHGGKDDKFAMHDTNGDGYISAEEMKAHKEGKCGEGKCGADKKKAAEGKCGEGKCGSM